MPPRSFQEQYEEPKRRFIAPFILLLLIIMALLLPVAAFVGIPYIDSPHPSFPVNTDVEITEGMSHNDITELLKQKNAVRSSLYLYLYLQGHYPDEFVKAGTYRFDAPLSTRELGTALIEGDHMAPNRKITLPEGFKARELGRYLPFEVSPASSTALEAYEGYLFPDTYFIEIEATLDDVVKILRDTYEKKMAPLRSQIEASDLTEAEVIILASIIEREAKDEDSKKIVAGILKERLRIGMALQVDAVFDYLLGKTSAELTTEDLELDSPYNTYLYAGLPPGPISNPGMESIMAVLEPTPTDYLYYLTGTDGNFYYAQTFEQHKVNKERHLR